MGLEKINTIFLDVDGTMTDGKLYIDNHGNEMKAFDVKDGMIVFVALRAGLDVIIITGRKSKLVDIRAAELGIKDVYQGIGDKVSKVDEILIEKKISYQNICYIGDDINDLEVIKRAGFAACPRDAASQVIKEVDMVSNNDGGNGAVREIVEHILTEKGLM